MYLICYWMKMIIQVLDLLDEDDDNEVFEDIHGYSRDKFTRKMIKDLCEHEYEDEYEHEYLVIFYERKGQYI